MLGCVPEVTVVVPTHNRHTLLRTTLRSVLAQRDVDLEIIVVDDGSTDATPIVVEGFDDARLRLVRHAAPQRVSRARNLGISCATGGWVSFCDDDDVWAPDKLAEQLASARRHGCDWAYTGVVNVDGSLQPVSAPPIPTPDEVVAQLPRFNAIPGGGSNVIVKRELLARVGSFDVELRNTEDWEMWLRLSRQGAPAVAPDRLVGYRIHDANASLDVREILNGVRRIERLHGTRVDRGLIHRWLAESCLRRGRRGEALRHWAVAAGRGNISGVLTDLEVLLRRRLGDEKRRDPDDGSRSEWASRAREWLDALARPDPDPGTR
jgi:glycosyltransferase involved in cell wall biosynthesis